MINFSSTVGLIPCSRFVTQVATPSLSALAACNDPRLAATSFLGSISLVARDNRIVTQAELDDAFSGPVDPTTLCRRDFSLFSFVGKRKLTVW